MVRLKADATNEWKQRDRLKWCTIQSRTRGREVLPRHVASDQRSVARRVNDLQPVPQSPGELLKTPSLVFVSWTNTPLALLTIEVGAAVRVEVGHATVQPGSQVPTAGKVKPPAPSLNASTQMPFAGL